MGYVEAIRFELAKPLLILKAAKGFLACGYINVETTNATGEAAAIVKGVNSFDDMKKASVVAVSKAAQALGVEVGDTGETALTKMG